MKKFTSALLVCVLVLGLAFTLVSCGNTLSGTYEGTICDLKFKGDKVTVIILGDEALTGTYEIKEEDEKKTITFDFVDEENATEDEKKALVIIDALLKGAVSFEEDGDTIKLAKHFKFTKSK